jgi:hypothetical protein
LCHVAVTDQQDGQDKQGDQSLHAVSPSGMIRAVYADVRWRIDAVCVVQTYGDRSWRTKGISQRVAAVFPSSQSRGTQPDTPVPEAETRREWNSWNSRDVIVVRSSVNGLS